VTPQVANGGGCQQQLQRRDLVFDSEVELLGVRGTKVGIDSGLGAGGVQRKPSSRTKALPGIHC